MRWPVEQNRHHKYTPNFAELYHLRLFLHGWMRAGSKKVGSLFGLSPVSPRHHRISMNLHGKHPLLFIQARALLVTVVTMVTL